jgi:outer membrane protein
MKNVLKPLSLAAAISAALISGQAIAYDAGDWIVRGGATTVAPDEDSGLVALNGSTAALGDNSKVSVDDDTQLGLTVEYMLNSNWGVEVLAATPFSHTASAKGGTLSTLTDDVADVKQLPPTVSAVYHFNNGEELQPYVGVGINYTVFFSEDLSSDTVAVLGDGNVELDDSWGLALQIGVDYHLNERWLVNASVRWIDIDTEATIKLDSGSRVDVDVDIDPMVYSVMVGYKF